MPCFMNAVAKRMSHVQYYKDSYLSWGFHPMSETESQREDTRGRCCQPRG